MFYYCVFRLGCSSINTRIILNSIFQLSQPILSLTFPLSLFSCFLPAEAFGMLKEADKKGVALGPSTYDHLIRALLAEGSMDEAMAVKDM